MIPLKKIQRYVKQYAEVIANILQCEVEIMETVEEHIVPIDEMFPDYRKLTVLEEYEKLLYNGNAFPAAAVSMQEADLMEQECFRIYDSHAAFIGIFRWSACVFKPVKMFYSDGQPGK